MNIIKIRIKPYLFNPINKVVIYTKQIKNKNNLMFVSGPVFYLIILYIIRIIRRNLINLT